jgi:hypothetical protein
LVGAAIVVVEVVLAVGRAAKWLWTKDAARRGRQAKKQVIRDTARENFKVADPNSIMALRFLKAQNIRRFPAEARNTLLTQMCAALFLERDPETYKSGRRECYYIVPDHIWDQIEQMEITKGIEHDVIPVVPPWIEAYRI